MRRSLLLPLLAALTLAAAIASLHRKKREDEQIDRACAEPRKRHAMPDWLGGDEQPNNLSQILPREIGGEERGRVVSRG